MCSPTLWHEGPGWRNQSITITGDGDDHLLVFDGNDLTYKPKRYKAGDIFLASDSLMYSTNGTEWKTLPSSGSGGRTCTCGQCDIKC